LGDELIFVGRGVGGVDCILSAIQWCGTGNKKLRDNEQPFDFLNKKRMISGKPGCPLLLFTLYHSLGLKSIFRKTVDKNEHHIDNRKYYLLRTEIPI